MWVDLPFGSTPYMTSAHVSSATRPRTHKSKTSMFMGWPGTGKRERLPRPRVKKRKTYHRRHAEDAVSPCADHR